jgi:hypothetical protein
MRLGPAISHPMRPFPNPPRRHHSRPCSNAPTPGITGHHAPIATSRAHPLAGPSPHDGTHPLRPSRTLTRTHSPHAPAAPTAAAPQHWSLLRCTTLPRSDNDMWTKSSLTTSGSEATPALDAHRMPRLACSRTTSHACRCH